VHFAEQLIYLFAFEQTVAIPQLVLVIYRDYELSLRLNSHFPDGSGLAANRTSPFWILFELRMMEVVVTTGAIRRAKLQ